MQLIADETFNDVYPQAVRMVMRSGARSNPRGTTTKELVHTAINVTNSEQHLVTSIGRPVNVAFALAEVVWILSGRRDVAFLEPFNSRIASFSDDGEVFNAAYGWRLREEFGYDQIDDVFRTLTEDPDSRQAVLQTWAPREDRGHELDERGSVVQRKTKDRACLAGDTTMWSPEGDLPIRKIAEKFASGEVDRWPVYAVDPKTLRQRITWATDVWSNGVKPTIRLSFDDDTSLQLTSDHELYIKRRVKTPGGHPNATYMQVVPCRAGELQPGDRILATRRWYGTIGHEWHKKQLDKNTSYSNRAWTHREYAALLWGPIPEGHDVHHVNEIKTDNREANLQVMPHGEHSAINVNGDRNPMRRMTAEQHAQRAAKHSASLKETWARRKAVDNHLVVSVEEAGEAEVFDFTVPGEHTALVGSGIVAHNCNTQSQLLVRDGALHWLQVQRSNDMIWGTPYNYMQFSHLQKWIASLLGVDVGEYTHIVNSLHIYDDYWSEAEGIRGFDLYYELGINEELDWGKPSEDLLDILCAEIESMQKDPLTHNNSKIKDDLPTYWYSALNVMQAHLVYRLGSGNESMAFHLLTQASTFPVYGAAQLRLFWQNRWSKAPEDHQDFIMNELHSVYPPRVAQWIYGV